MEWIAYKLSVKVLYEKPVADEYFQMKCLSRIDETQKIVELKEEIRPRDCMVKKRMDDAKNQYILGYMAKAHSEITYEAEGTVQIQKYNRKPESREMLYRISSPYTEIGQNLGEWYGELNLPEGEIRDRALWIAGFVKRKLKKREETEREGLLTADQANALNGYLHMRFYRDELNDAGHYGNPQHTKENKAEDGTVTVTRPYVAYGYTTAYPRDAYMGLFISDLHFYARSWTQDGDETKTPRITAMTVVLTVAKRDANDQIVPLCTQKAIVQLPGEPVILYEPGTWDGKASSES